MTPARLFGLGVFLLAPFAPAEVRLPQLFGDGMVFQREAPLPFWGWAEPGEKVTVELNGLAASAVADEDGQWQVELPPASAGGPHTVLIRGENVRQLTDVFIGEVWLASGQSNMELPMRRIEDTYPDEIASASYPEIRYFAVGHAENFHGPSADLPSGRWQVATPETVREFAAVPYFFAKEIQRAYGVPVGIINASAGGTPAESWMSEEALAAFPDRMEEALALREPGVVEDIESNKQTIESQWYGTLDKLDAGLNSIPSWFHPDYDSEGWLPVELPGFFDEVGIGSLHGSVWFRKTIEIPEGLAGRKARLDLGAIIDADTVWLNGEWVGSTGYQYPPRRYTVPKGVLREGANELVVRVLITSGRGGFVLDKPYALTVGEHGFPLKGSWLYRVGAATAPIEPTIWLRTKPMGLFNTMIAPLTRFPIKGVIWYQGESNAGRPDDYFDLMSALIGDWRAKWADPGLPFLYVQLANFMAPAEGPEESGWVELREHQRRLLTLPQTGMAVAVDLGEWNDIHPERKEPVGQRLALAARKVAYGETDLVAFGPLYQRMEVQDGQAVLTFDSVGSGLVTSDGKALGGFAIAGADGHFVRADAVIDGERVIISSVEVPAPVRVRYAWANNPVSANLANREGLPASPFEAVVFGQSALPAADSP